MEVIVNNKTNQLYFKDVNIGEVFQKIANDFYIKIKFSITEEHYGYNAVSIKNGKFAFFTDDDPIDKIFNKIILE